MSLKQAAVFIDSMSYGQSALLVALCSVLIVWPVRRVRVLNALGVVGVSLAVAYCFCWLPVWLDPPDLSNMRDLHRLDTYAAWSGLRVAMLFVAAFFASAIVVAVADRRARRARARALEAGASQSRHEEGDRPGSR